MRTLITNGTVVSRGSVIVRDGEFTGRKGHGQFIPRGRADHVRLS